MLTTRVHSEFVLSDGGTVAIPIGSKIVFELYGTGAGVTVTKPNQRVIAWYCNRQDLLKILRSADSVIGHTPRQYFDVSRIDENYDVDLESWDIPECTTVLEYGDYMAVNMFLSDIPEGERSRYIVTLMDHGCDVESLTIPEWQEWNNVIL